MLRRPSTWLLAFPAVLLAGAALGVQLGQSAIAEINPVHFQGPEPRPQGIDPGPDRPAEASFAQAYGWEDGRAARAQECGGDCDAGRARRAIMFAPVVAVPVRTASGPYWRDATPTTEPKPWPAGETGDPSLSVGDYLHYPIEEGAEPPSDDTESGEDE